MTRGRCELSIVLPCYAAAPVARRSVAALRDFLSQQGISWEIIVVDDGGGDFEPHEWNDDPHVSLVRFPRNRGKGAAVRAGLLAARGDARVFTDVDLPFGTEPLAALNSLLRQRSVHLVIGDRRLPGSSYHLQMPWARRMASAVFTAFVGTILTGGYFDTQCGLKGVRGDVADVLFPLLRLDGFAFDVELVCVAREHHLGIRRVPVRLERNDTSSVRLLRDSLQGFIDVFRIKFHQWRGHYVNRRLEDLVRRDAEGQAPPAESLATELRG